MKKFKKLIISVIVFPLLVIVIGSTFSSAAWWAGSASLFNSIGYGTYEGGVPFTNHIFLYPAVEIDGGPNLNFEKGLQYWKTGDVQYVKINTEVVDGKKNTYLTLTPEKLYNGATSIMFPVSKLKAGDTPGILYKWRGNSHACQITLKEVYSITSTGGGQWNSAKTEWVGHNGAQGAASIWSADEDNEKEWNIQFAINNKPVQPLAEDSLSDKLYYFIGVEAFAAPEISYGMDIDDIQIVLHNSQSRTVSDLDGKIIYNLNNLPKREVVHYMFGDLDDKDPNAKDKTDVDKLISKLSSTPPKAQGLLNIGNLSSSDSSEGVWLWIVIAAAVLLIIAAAVVTVIIIKRKKSVSGAESVTEAEETPETPPEE